MNTRTITSTLLALCVIASLSCACRGKSKKSDTRATVQTNVPVQYTYKVKNIYPHDPGSFTQGLYWHDGHLWESTGQYGESRLLKTDLYTGRILQSADVGNEYFAEGAALLDGKIYQLTWQNGVAFVYDPQTLNRTGQFRSQGEGWGLTTDGTNLYMSDGSPRIIVIDPSDFSRKRSITVRTGRRTQRMLNELEWIEGKIWANIYLTDEIVIIDPTTGSVEGVVDLRGLLPANEYTADTNVLNGIAYDPVGKRIFVTGKYWPKLFEIELVKKEEQQAAK